MTKYATVDPTTGKVVAGFATMREAEVEQALARAAGAYRSWRETGLAGRAALGIAVHTRDQDQAAYVANRLAVGMVGLSTTIKSAPDLPFGGVKNSGAGREPGRFGPGEFSNKKLIHIA